MEIKKRRLVYMSQGTDDVSIICDSLENAIHCFRADADTILSDKSVEPYDIHLSIVEMTDEELKAIEEV